jgi:hypothetical protein
MFVLELSLQHFLPISLTLESIPPWYPCLVSGPRFLLSAR